METSKLKEVVECPLCLNKRMINKTLNLPENSGKKCFLCKGTGKYTIVYIEGKKIESRD